MTNYIATGYVLGNLWGGGEGAYPSSQVEAKTRKEVLRKAKKELSTGGLDSGMGFESLIGALLTLRKIETIIVKNKDYLRSDYEDIFIGKLSGKQEEFLSEVQFNSL